MKIRAMMLALLVLVMVASAEAKQSIKATPEPTERVSAFLIGPSEGVAELPAGWTRDTSDTHTNVNLADENLAPAAGAATLTTTSTKLPKADYIVSMLCIGKAKARIKGAADWVTVGGHADSYYRWTRIGIVKNATRVEVEVAPTGDSFRYGGLCAEGSTMPVVPVAKVLERLRKGEAVTICLMGDSVQENAKGHRGGSKDFASGVNGLLKAMLEKEFGNEVSYVSHREPEGRPDDAGITLTYGDNGKESGRTYDESKMTFCEVDGKRYRDGRSLPDVSKKIRVVNMAKGGAASHDGWSRFGDTFTEANVWRLTARINRKTGKVASHGWIDFRDTKLPPVLRVGVAGYKPDLVTINFGTNDANGSHKSWTADDYLWHMKVLVTMAQQKLGAAVIVTTPHLWTRGTHQQPHTQPEMADAIRRYARASGVRLADVYNEFGPGEYHGIHPGTPGHKHLATAYMKALLGRPSEPKVTAQTTAAKLTDGGDGTVTDTSSGLMWTRSAGLSDKRMTQAEAEAFVAAINAEKKFGHADWRLPTRDELLSLVDPAQRPALPKGHPFENVGRYYLSTTQEMKRNFMVDYSFGGIAYWYARMDGQSGLVWPLRSAK